VDSNSEDRERLPSEGSPKIMKTPMQTMVLLCQWLALHQFGAFADDARSGRALSWEAAPSQALSAIEVKGHVEDSTEKASESKKPVGAATTKKGPSDKAAKQSTKDEKKPEKAEADKGNGGKNKKENKDKTEEVDSHEGAPCCAECGWESKFCKGTTVVRVSSNGIPEAPTLMCQDVAEENTGFSYCYLPRILSEVIV